MNGARFSGKRRLVIPALLLALHIGVSAGGPILHGRGEVLHSGSAFESAHSHSCAVIHDEAFCTAASLHQTIGAAPVAVLATPAAEPVRPFLYVPAPRLPGRDAPSNTVRAPPLNQ